MITSVCDGYALPGIPRIRVDLAIASLQYTITGTVKVGEIALENVVMTGLPGTVKTNASGQYSGTVNYGWTGTVTPTLAGYMFSPVSRSYTSIAANQSGQNYAATVIPTIQVTSPNGGESWIWGSANYIRWTTAGTVASVKLEYSTNNGTNWTILPAPTNNTGNYLWTLPETISSACLAWISTDNYSPKSGGV